MSNAAATTSTAATVVRAFTLAARANLDQYLDDVQTYAEGWGQVEHYEAEVPGMREIFAEANAYAWDRLNGESLAEATAELAALQTELAEYYDSIANPAPPAPVEIFEGPQTYETTQMNMFRQHMIDTLADAYRDAHQEPLRALGDADDLPGNFIRIVTAEPAPLDFMHTPGDADKWATPLGEAARADLLALAAETGEDPDWLLAGNGTERLMKKHRADIANYVRHVNELMPSIAPAVERAFETALQGEEPGTTNGHDAAA